MSKALPAPLMVQELISRDGKPNDWDKEIEAKIVDHLASLGAKRSAARDGVRSAISGPYGLDFVISDLRSLSLHPDGAVRKDVREAVRLLVKVGQIFRGQGPGGERLRSLLLRAEGEVAGCPDIGETLSTATNVARRVLNEFGRTGKPPRECQVGFVASEAARFRYLTRQTPAQTKDPDGGRIVGSFAIYVHMLCEAFGRPALISDHDIVRGIKIYRAKSTADKPKRHRLMP